MAEANALAAGTSLDPSIPLRAGQGVAPMAPFNPLATMGQAMQLRALANQNALFPGQQQLQDQAITGGDLDNQSKALAVQQAQLLQAQNRAKAIMGFAGPALAKGDAVTHGDLIDFLAAAEANNIPTGAMIADVVKNFPMDGPGIAKALRSRLSAGLTPEGVLAASTPTPTLVQQGGAQVPQTIAPAMAPNVGARTNVGTAIPNTPTVGDMNNLTQVWNPATKQFDYKPRAQVAPMVDGAGNPVGGAPAPVAPGLPASGRNAPTPASAPTAPPVSSAASAPLGTADEVGISVTHAGLARDKANNYQQTIQPIEGALTALKGADTGRASEFLNSIRANVQDVAPGFIQRMMPNSVTDPAKREAFEEAQKYTTAMQLGSPGSTRSDAGQAAGAASNANVHISNAAAIHVANAVLAQRRMEQAGTLAFNNAKGTDGQPLPASEYDRYMNKWNTNQDPRAYIADKMEPADRAALVAGMGGIKSAAYQKFRQSYQQGTDTGVVPNHGAN
jgi:hypothetical protein